jgi:hypothetical protein
MCRFRREIKPYCLPSDNYDPARLVLPQMASTRRASFWLWMLPRCS